jgi:Cu/Zn superoxide dismutase
MLMAKAIFNTPCSSIIKGSIVFTQHDSTFVRVDINLKKVPIGIHGIHVHEEPIRYLRDLKDKNCCDILGGHFNASMPLWSESNKKGTPHGSYTFNTIRHIGDLCNNIVSVNGTVKVTYIDNLISLIPGEPNCIVGRSIVIHENEDDEGFYISEKGSKKEKKLETQSKITGNAGNRIACANIVGLS